MATWRRCPKGPFYHRAAHGERFDKRLNAFDKAYVDPIELVLVRTIPYREDQVTVLRWRVEELDADIFGDLVTEEDKLLLAWAERVVDAIDGPDGSISKGRKEALFADLDVDGHSRDLLLDAVEHLVNASPPAATSLIQKKIPRSDEAVRGLLFHFGVGPC